MIFQSRLAWQTGSEQGGKWRRARGVLPRCLLPWSCQLLCDDPRTGCLSLDSEEVSWLMWPVQVRTLVNSRPLGGILERSQSVTHGWNIRKPFSYLTDKIQSWVLGTFGFCCCSVTKRCLTLCNPSTPSLSVHHQVLELTQTHVHWVSDAIQPSHPLLSSSPPTFNLSQHQGLFQWISSSHQVAKVLEPQFQHQSFQWIFRTDFL